MEWISEYTHRNRTEINFTVVDSIPTLEDSVRIVVKYQQGFPVTGQQ